MLTLSGKKIILGVCGSIAAYKSLLLLRLLVKAGAEVEVIMTESATDFVGPLSFSTLSGKPVKTQIHSDADWQNHVHLGMWADLMVVVPATAQTIAKMAHGFVDNLLTAVFLSAKCPIMFAPAMDLDMWQNPATKRNIRLLTDSNIQMIPVEDGSLASGLSGLGRLAETEMIFEIINDHFNKQDTLAGRRILITAGPTLEAIDPVRFISNHSSGKMGIRIAEECLRRGAKVHLILGPTNENISESPELSLFRVVSADEMYTEVKSVWEDMTDFILAAAVADYKPVNMSVEKIKKTADQINIELTKTPDIAAFLGINKKQNQKLVGFALETTNALEYATSKLHKKNMDLIVLNTTGEIGVGFGYDTNQIVLIDRNGHQTNFDKKSKKEVATDIVNALLLL
ncbi:MAG: bifunctional phosphopantothenoylcysteine decarboxylase/phosphopantothenate--cysteine ligase CoaBC [Saprospiraceae bacterium]|nr:bifunctional phosphopantothenoylcysteine decarboxylase/phosphopantothenate--cysteine ligase CoaBC [Saprospiraceae bacterium]